jgi:predicted PurR-regulated permease PerM
MSTPPDRRRDDRRRDFVSLAEYTVPELRKALLTVTLLVLILALFVYMIHDVMVAVFAGIVAGIYLIPLDRRIRASVHNKALSAILTIIMFTVPLLLILAYSWFEISSAASYLRTNDDMIVGRLNDGIRELPWTRNFDLQDEIERGVTTVTTSIAEIVDELGDALGILSLGIAVFLFTTFYILTDHGRLLIYLGTRVPGRYRSLVDPVIGNIRNVIYGVLYGTFLTQALKSVIILVLNLVWQVPLALVLAIASFFVGLLPIVGSWSIYTPVAAYLILWRGDVVGGVVMLVVGFVGNTIFISTYLRPKIAAEKSKVLNFYWMFIALVTGVYTFGLMGIIIGPVLIAMLKAILDSISADELTTAGGLLVPPEAIDTGD